MGKVKFYMRKAFKTFNKMEMRILPGNIAFFFVLALIPMITIVIVITSSFGISMDSVISLVRSFVPGDAGEVIVDAISGRGFDSSVGIFCIIAFISASNGTYAIINASNTLYHVSNRDVLRDRVKSFILLLIMLIVIVFLLVVPMFGEKIISLFKNNELFNSVRFFYQLLKWPLTIFLIYINLKLVYTISPDKRISSGTTRYGAIFTTIIWTVVTAIFSFYLKYFTNYNVFYGNLSSIIILMMWLYIISYVFVMGIAINVTRLEDN